MAFAVVLFAAVLAVIATERVDRTKVALVGATLILITQTIDQDVAIEAIDWNTLGLLAGMMLMVKITETTGIYTWLAIRAGQLSRGRPLAVVFSLATTTAILSAFLDNLTTVLLIVPITFLLADALDLDPIPLEPATVALTGATAMLLVSRQPLERSLAGIEWPTLFFFIALFVMVGALEHTGAIDEVAAGIGSLTAGDRTAELLGITWASAIGSGLVDNIPFTAAMIPVVEQLQSGNDGDDAYWWALALGACFGGNATLIAAAANVAAAGMAARAGRPIGFMTFLRIGLPATAVSLLLATAYIALRYL
jgi:Na+/H+ antiporter NhaD/arsenite permease-like protein